MENFDSQDYPFSDSQILNKLVKFLDEWKDPVYNMGIDYVCVQPKNTFQYIMKTYKLSINQEYGDFLEDEMHALHQLKTRFVPELKICDRLLEIYGSIPMLQVITPENVERDVCAFRYSVSDNRVYSDVHMIDLKSCYPTYIVNNGLFSAPLFQQMISLREEGYNIKRIQNALTGTFKCPDFQYKNYDLYYEIIGGVKKIVQASRDILEENGFVVLYGYTDSLHFQAGSKYTDTAPEKLTSIIKNLVDSISKKFGCKWVYERKSE